MTPQVLYKAQAFAIRIVKAHEYLVNEKKEYRISDQLYRSGTAIAALIAEAEFAQSKADFISKMQIALKEANESKIGYTYYILPASLTKDPTNQFIGI